MGGHVVFGGSLNRTQWTVMHALQCFVSLASLLIFASLRKAQQRTSPGVPAGPGACH